VISSARRLGIGLLAATFLCSCGASQAAATADHVAQLREAAVTFEVGGQRFALALLAPPASMVLLRTGPVFWWMSPSPALHDVYLEDVIDGTPVATHVLQVNPQGTLDYTVTLRWAR
jgi:hypothetical protein